MKSFILLSCFFLCAFSATCFAQPIQHQNRQLPVLDKTKSYPSKKLEFDTEVTYVPLETSKEILMGGGCKLNYASNEKFIFSDVIPGDVFIFDRNGKIYSHFNKKGGLGYTFITYIAYDEKRKELFILDGIINKIFVFSEKGVLLRSFRMLKDTHLSEIYNFDDKTLLALNEPRYGSAQAIKPYFYMAKDDGKIVGHINIELDEVNPVSMEPGENGYGFSFTHYGIPDNCKFGNDFILANRSMDTVYLLKQNKTLIPLFTQIPSVYAEHPTAASVGMITDQFLKICVSTYDVKEALKITKSGKRWRPKFGNFIFDIETGEFFEDSEKGEFTVYKVDTPKNQCYRLMQAINLVKANKKGLLKGELKEIASRLNIGDNPVLKIEKFK